MHEKVACPAAAERQMGSIIAALLAAQTPGTPGKRGGRRERGGGGGRLVHSCYHMRKIVAWLLLMCSESRSCSFKSGCWQAEGPQLLLSKALSAGCCWLGV